jgi:hypothetical protein
MSEVGRNTILTEELVRKIRQSILDGNDLKTTAKLCDINELTLYDWSSSNYLNLKDKIEGWRRDRKLMLAERNLEAILCLGISDKDSLKVVSDMTKFTLETLAKKEYSKRTESDLTSGGKPIYLPSQLIDKYDNTPSETSRDSSEQEKV